MDKKTVLVDGFDGYKIDNIDEITDSTDDVLLIKNSKDNNTEQNSISTVVQDSSRLGAFYQVKKRIDSNMSSDITILCSKAKGNLWFTICKEILTTSYKLEINTGDDCASTYDESYCSEIQKFLSSYETKDEVEILKSNIINDKFIHGFSTRKGGMSTAIGVSSLNMTAASIKRDSEMIGRENIHRLGTKAGFNPKNFLRARAVHGNTVYVVGKEEPKDGYDCIISNQKDITVAAPGADCVTMIFADHETPAFGACHSGWKGTLAKACVETVKKMQDEYGSKLANIRVALGPSIGSCCLEFAEEDAALFKSINENSIKRKEGKVKPFIDLHLVNRTLLESHGIAPSHIDDTSATLCTSCNPELFFSYRRDGIPFGNQVGFIGLK
ncbi:purine nucleoside phosphorylase LACC1-like [Mytilus californianus]|uniref:purine nucleoside phosphorylase LACC1-like n=1 Tax=Mytilus californianus TaxID=6549 RepID=UPI0022483A88|nr:purine nucleoside phosphorylase LACC1-like [Mytilus californianus]